MCARAGARIAVSSGSAFVQSSVASLLRSSVMVAICRVRALALVCCGVHALPPITVQYEVPLSSVGRFAAEADFDARAARLAEKLSDADGQVATVKRASPTSFMSDITSTPASTGAMAAQFPNASAASLRTALSDALAQAMLAEGLPGSELQCARDYNSPCPLGWVDRANGGVCDAPVSYEGPCGSSLDFGGLAAHQKMALAHSCVVAFACGGACTPDYSEACPVGWSVGAAGVCLAPAEYAGPCVGQKDFGQYVWADKLGFESECAVRWPCRTPWSNAQRPEAAETCAADFSQPCPHGWSSRGGACIAPASYAGPCAIAWSTDGYKTEEKRAMSEACDAPWPCGR